MGYPLTNMLLGLVCRRMVCLGLRAGRVHRAAADDRTATCTGTKFCESHFDGHIVFPSYQHDRFLSPSGERSPETISHRRAELPKSLQAY